MTAAMKITRRTLLASASMGLAGAAWPAKDRSRLVEALEALARPEGGYGWESDNEAHVTPTFAVTGCYKLLGVEPPRRVALASFLQTRYPVPEIRRKERPLWRFDWEQVQALQWLGADTSMFRDRAAQWTGPAPFTRTYELDGNPVFQHQAFAVMTRSLLGIESKEPAWSEYFVARRRSNGTFNNTPAADGSSGHVMNTLWGLWATKSECTPALAEWVRACQRPGGGFTYAPDATIGAVEDMGYTWAALRVLSIAGAEPRDRRALIGFLDRMRQADGLWADVTGGRGNPLATYYALDSLSILRHVPADVAPKRRASARSIPAGLRVFTMQIEAPGRGSPEEAVTMAEAAGVHIWAAKNSPAGWVEAAQRAAGRRGVPVRFAVGNEEYGTYVKLPGLGTYSHLVDLCAPAAVDFGSPMPPKVAHPWTAFRDTRIPPLRRAQGQLVWQFNENEELTRILLDEAVATGTYAAISSFHFGNENFLHSQPFLHRWYGRLPMVALQDAHHAESWWSADQIVGFRTLFLAKEPTWDGWLQAVERDWVMPVRRDTVTAFQLRFGGGLPEVREYVMRKSAEWQWWSDAKPWVRRPLTSAVIVRAGDAFEAAAPAEGSLVRVRLAAQHTPHGLPREPLADLVRVVVDGREAPAEAIETRGPNGAVSDRYHLVRLTAAEHDVRITVRERANGSESTMTPLRRPSGA
jgi:hypothetical protein